MQINWLNWLMLLGLSAIWGSSFILMKLGMYTSEHTPIFSSNQVAALRMTIAGIALLPWSISAFKKLKNKKDLAPLFIVGLCGNFLPAFLFTYAETGLSSGYTGMLNSFTPIFAIIIGFVVFGNKLNQFQITGLIVGTIGITGLSLAGNPDNLEADALHILAVILATLFYAVSMNTLKFKLSHLSGIDITSIAFLLVLPPALILAFFTGSTETITHNPNATQGLLAITTLSVVGTAFAVFIFSVLIARSTLLFSSSVTYLIPIFAAFIGLGFGEQLNLYQFLSMAVVLSGVYIANVMGRPRKKS